MAGVGTEPTPDGGTQVLGLRLEVWREPRTALVASTAESQRVAKASGAIARAVLAEKQTQLLLAPPFAPVSLSSPCWREAQGFV